MPNLSNLSPISGARGFINHIDQSPSYWMQGIRWIMLADREEMPDVLLSRYGLI